MKIKTERLVLEPLGTKHYESTLKYSTDPGNTRMMCFLPCDDGTEVMDYLRNCEIQWQRYMPKYLDAAVILDEVHIGAVSVELLEGNKVGELGWILDKHYWGNGYAVEAAKAFIEYIKERFGIDHFIAHCDGDNQLSARALEKLGMTLKESYNGRKNRNSAEERIELLYELNME